MHIWSFSICLVLIYYTCSVHSQQCYYDHQCDQGKVCCGVYCASRCGGSCQSDADCSSGDRCSSGTCLTPTLPPVHTFPGFNIPTFKPFTFKPYTYAPDNDYCVWDSDCFGDETCEDGQCIKRLFKDRDKGAFSWSGSKVIGIVFFAAVATVLSCLYHMCKKARNPPVPATQNAPPTGVAREATTPTHATELEMQPGNAVSSGATVVEVEEVNEDSPPLPPGAPPPYSSLELEPQQRNENDEPELPPPSYDEAVRNSTMALV